MAATAKSIFDNFRRAYPDDSILIYTFTPPGGAGSFNGIKLLETTLEGGESLRVFKLTKSSGFHMNPDEIRVKAFPFVSDTGSMKDNTKRRDCLVASLKNIFPDHNLNVFIFGSTWSRYNHSRGAVGFRNEYGPDVDIVLS